MSGMEIVYAVYKFKAENADEISLNVGEKVIVIEKDEGYNDGWWQGRNEQGQIGLFPITYTSNKPPKSKLIEEWTSEQVADWLINVGFEKEIAVVFKEQEITGDILLELTLDSLKELQIKTFGKRFKIHNAINALRLESKKHTTHHNSKAYVDHDNDIIQKKKLSTTSSIYSSIPPRPSIPLDMNLISNASKLSNVIQYKRPISHQPPPSITNVRNDWRRNTVTQPIPQENNNFTNNQLYTILPNTTVNHISKDDTPDMEGWLYKQGDKYKNWNKRWFVLKSNNLFYFKNPKAVRMKGIINLKGYKIIVDETIHSGHYCFKAQHDKERTFYFYTEHEKFMKEWLKALMKVTISRDYSTPVMSSNTIPTVSLEQARKMRPRPPSTIFHNQQFRSPTPLNFDSVNQNFSLMSIDKQPNIIHSRASSVQSSMLLSDQYSENRLKDSGYNSHFGRLSGSITINSSQSTNTRPFQPEDDEEQDDDELIDPENNMNEKRELTTENIYVEWINGYLTHKKIKRISDLSLGESLLEILEFLSHKEIPRTRYAQTVNAQRMDCIISAFKFMSLEGIELDGICTIRDVANGNEAKIIHLLETIEYWYKLNRNVKKSFKGRTFENENNNEYIDVAF